MYGSIDDEKVHALPLLLPRRATPSSGTLEVTTTASLLGDFTEAATYLSDYPYGCVEQSASRLVPLVALHALGDRTREAEAAREQASAIVGHILSMQLTDGSFAYWPGSATSAGFGGGYALWILQLGRRAWLAVMAFIWVALVYVILAFADITASTFVGRTEDLEGLALAFNPGGAVALASVLYLLLSIVMGVAEVMVVGYLSPTYRDAIAFVLLILILLVRPAGMLGRHVAEKV